jgi:hypothetical protein
VNRQHKRNDEAPLVPYTHFGLGASSYEEFIRTEFNPKIPNMRHEHHGAGEPEAWWLQGVHDLSRSHFVVIISCQLSVMKSEVDYLLWKPTSPTTEDSDRGLLAHGQLT